MATTYNASYGAAVASKPGSSLLERFFNRFIEARQQQATRIVREHMRTFDPNTLRSIGYTEDEISAIYNRVNI